MPDDRRSATRTRLSGLFATYESADGVSHRADVLNLSRAGLFLETEARVPVGKRLSLEVHASGEPAPWPALGRVIWTRLSYEGDGRPCGMGVKLIDVEDAVVEAIERFVDLREGTEPGIGQEPKDEYHAHEHLYAATILGMGAVSATEVAPTTASDPFVPPLLPPLEPLASIAVDTPRSLGPPAVEEDGAPDLAIDLIRRSEGQGPSVNPGEPDEPSPPRASVRMRVAEPVAAPAPMVVVPAPDPVPRPGGRGWVVAVIVVIVIASAAYALRGLVGFGP
jgi:Tfp pilus assembly protein PilZ